jgi:predicted enzyme related to lactoylglutathione lyase
MTASQSGSPFCHVVIPAPDLDKAKAFYETVFGWTVKANEPGATYWFFTSGNVGGAFDGTRKAARGAVQLVLRVPDLAAACARVAHHGGTITQAPSAIGKADPGNDAYFLDPNGNEMGLYAD